MALSPRITAAVANAMLDAGIGIPADGGKIFIYSGTQPATGGGSLSGNTLLGTLTLGADAFPAASANVLTANAITPESSAPSGGTATWFRMTQSDGTTVLMDGSVGTSGTDLVITTTTIVLGGVITATSLTITHPRS